MRVSLLAWARESGGAERQLVNLARGLYERGHEVAVTVFFPNDYVQGPLREAGIPHDVLDVRGTWDVGRFVGRYLAARASRADVVYGFLLVPNLLTLPWKLLGHRLVWGIRMTDPNLFRYNWLTGPAHTLERRLSRFADLVIVNSLAGRNHTLAYGFERGKVRVVENGIETDRFVPDRAGGRRLRKAWGIPERVRLIGAVARLEAKKNHETFLRAAAAFGVANGDARFVCIGDGSPAVRGALEHEASRLGLDSQLLWLPAQGDMPAVYNALDVLTLTSAFGEGFPNVLAEAMACGLPCVATDVGDSRRIVDGLGRIVPPRSPRAVIDAWEELLAVDRERFAGPARERIVRHFGLDRMVERTEELLEAIL